MIENYNPDTNDLSKKTKQTAQEVTDKASKLADKAGDKVSSGVKKGEDALENVAQQVKDQSAEAYDSAVNYFKKHPATSLSLAILAGVVVGALLSK